jgi:hypothetical protein
MYLLNISPTRSVERMMSYEAWHERKLSLAHLRTFGRIVYIKNTKPHLSKLEERSTMIVFIGYRSRSKAHHTYDPCTVHVSITRDVVFDDLAQWY